MSWTMFGENFNSKHRRRIEKYNLEELDSTWDSIESGSLISFLSDTTNEEDWLKSASQSVGSNPNNCISPGNEVVENKNNQSNRASQNSIDYTDHRRIKTNSVKSLRANHINNNSADVLKIKEIEKISQSVQCDMNLHMLLCYNKEKPPERYKSLCSLNHLSRKAKRRCLYTPVKYTHSDEFYNPLIAETNLRNMSSPGFNSSLDLSHEQFTSPLSLHDWIRFDSNAIHSSSKSLRKTSTNSSQSRKHWIAFEESEKFPLKSPRMEDGANSPGIDGCLLRIDGCSQRVDGCSPGTGRSPDNSYDDELIFDKSIDEEMLLNNAFGSTKSSSSENLNERTKSLSMENILNTVSEKLNILKKEENDDEKNLVEEKSSEISDELISLDYESEDERKKLRDTPVKRYPNLSLFQASSIATSDKITQTIQLSPTLSDSAFDTYPIQTNRSSWSFWYRYPDNTRRIRNKKWIPVTVTLDSGFIKVNGFTKKGTEICKEYPLHPFFVFTIPKIHRGNKDGAVHSVKLQYVKYKECRRMKKGASIEHVPVYTSILKFASRDLIAIREFLSEVERYIRQIPTYRNNIVTYRQEGLFIDCDDDCHYLFSGDGTILQYNITVQLRLRTFFSGSTHAILYLNDINNKQYLIDKNSENNRLPVTWIDPKMYEYHPCVDTSFKEGGVRFLPPDGCSFELLRLRVKANNPPPLIAKSSLEILSHNSIQLKASLQVNESLRFSREDVLLYIPVPSSWSSLFVRSRSLRGRKKFVKVKATDRTGDAAEVTFNRVTLTVSVGSATYEPAFGSIVWRLGTLPIMHGYKPPDAEHVFKCRLDLPFSVVMPECFQPHCYVEFSVGRQIASDVIIHEVVVDDKKPEKWVCYRSNYIYKISMSLHPNKVDVSVY